MIMEYLASNEQRIYAVEQKLLHEMVTKEEMVQFQKEIKHYFDIIAENIRHDLVRGALNDKVQQHEDRILRLEKHAAIR